jgi:hypothetical protein
MHVTETIFTDVFRWLGTNTTTKFAVPDVVHPVIGQLKNVARNLM